jgi:hypothetical protein
MLLSQPFGFNSMLKYNQQQDNPGAVVITGAPTTIFTGTLNDYVEGDMILVNFRVDVVKGVTGGVTWFEALKAAGTAVLQFAQAAGNPRVTMDPQPANANDTFSMSVWFRVTLAGTASFKLQSASGGSNATVPANDGKMSVFGFRR